MSTRATNNRGERGGQPENTQRVAPASAKQRRAGRWRSLRNWRVRPRLVALIAIPTAVALILGGLRIWENATDTLTHQRIESMATLGESVAVLAHEIGNERMLTAAYIASATDPDRRDPARERAMEEQQRAVDQARNDVSNQIDSLGDPGSDLSRNKLSNMETALERLDGLREEVTSTGITVLPTVTKYRQLINTLISFNEEIAEETSQTGLRESVRALTSLTGAREELSYESALMLNALMRNEMSGGSQEAINTTRSRYENEIQNFMSTATVQERMIYDETYTGLDVSRMATMRLRVMMRARTDQPLTGVTAGDSAGEYEEVANQSLSLLHTVERNIAAGVTQQAGELRDSAMQRAVVESGLVLLVILAVFGITTLVARSMVRPLRILREGALRVANKDLPEAIHRMRESDGAQAETRIAPIAVDSQDEIGEVARSFDEVHSVALRLASDEASLRSNVNAMFVNLSRRSQSLVERQLRLIEGLEQGEQDSDRLGDLFQLDHLATRMRRNNENLLVLSGQENTRKWAQPVPLVDVLRGAISEVEHYERVNVRAPSQISVLGRPVNDIIHLVAELVENATAFSSHDTQVSVNARALDGGDVMVEVTDSGIGMAPEDLESINERLARPPEIDVAVSRRMGLFVVSRLAARHGVHVRLHPAHNGGITALIVLPSDLLITPMSPTPTPTFGGGAPSGVPNTYAEATAAFAASPAPAEPIDNWQSPPQLERSSWHSETSSGLPKRPVPNTEGEQRQPTEHPPSGNDLWNASSPQAPSAPEPVNLFDPNVNRTSQQPAPPPAPEPAPEVERPRPAEPERAATETGPVGTVPNGHGMPPTSQSGTTHGQDVWAAPSERSSGWSRPPEEANEPLRRRHSRTPESETREGYGSTAFLSRRPGSASGHTVVPPTPENNTDPLPIFDSVESNWFRRRTVRPVTAPDTGPLTPVDPETSQPKRVAPSRPAPEPAPEPAPAESAPARPTNSPEAEQEWRSEADVGWRAAETASQPVAGGLTQSGLPKRVPRANLVPGTAPVPEKSKQLPPRSADKVRNRLASLQDGVRQGRADTRGDRPFGER